MNNKFYYILSIIILVGMFTSYTGASVPYKQTVTNSIPDNMIMASAHYNPLIELVTTESLRIKLFEWCKLHSSVNVSEDILYEIVDNVIDREYSLLLFSMIKVESNFNPSAKSNKDACGLMQVTPSIWLSELSKEFPKIITVRDIYNISNNIDAGNYVIMKYYKKTGNWSKALNKYVGGDKAYVNKVLVTYAQLSLYLES